MWTPIENYDCYYFINKQGQIRSRNRYISYGNGRRRFVEGRIMKTRVNNCGYVEVRLSIGGFSKTYFIHRLMAQHYIPNPGGKPYINHKNGIKTDNRIENLEWVTHSENMKHAYQHDLLKCTCIQVVDICTGQVFESIKEAAAVNGLVYSTLKNYLSGKRKNPTCLRILD
jgi:hypothetical protein